MAETRSEWCVSVYMPVNEADAKKNRLRLKKLMIEAESKLRGLNAKPFQIGRILGPVEMIRDNPGFWKDRTEGFAAFFTADSFVWYSMQYQFDELVVVTDRFHLKPLIRNASENRRFHLLTLSEQQIRFFEASELGISEVYLKGIPRNLDFFFDSETEEEKLQSQTAGEAEDNKESKLAELFQRVDKVITNYLKDDQAPLVVAAADEQLHQLYQQANTFPHLVKTGINVGAGSLSPKQLLEKALPVVKPVFRGKREDALKVYREKLGTRLASNNISDIFRAAKDGRIETLFVPVGKQKWGQFDNKTDELQINEEAKPGDKDLLCVTSSRTLRKGGEVFVVLPEQMPEESSIAAVLRY